MMAEAALIEDHIVQCTPLQKSESLLRFTNVKYELVLLFMMIY